MPRNPALDAASPASVERPFSAIAMAVCIALGLSACGGGGGSNVKSTPPAGGGTPVVSPNVVTANLVVKSGESVTKPVLLTGTLASTARVNNAGHVGGAVDTAVSGISYSTSGDITNHHGGVIDGRQYAIRLGGLTLDNHGAGSTISSPGVALRADDGRSMITNADGASIIGGISAISLGHGGMIRNLAGGTIATTGSVPGDCGAGGSCAIYASPGTPGESGDIRLENAGTIIGNVQLAPTDSNTVVLIAGGTIQGNLDVGLNPRSLLTLDAGAGVTQQFSQAVTGSTEFHGAASKTGEGTWVLDTPALATSGYIDVVGGTLIVEDPDFLGRARLSAAGPVILDFDKDATLSNVFDGAGGFNGSPPSAGIFVKRGAGELTILDRNIGDGLRFLIENGTLRVAEGGSLVGRALVVENNTTLVLDGNLTSYLRISGTGSVVKTGSGNAAVGMGSDYTGQTRIEGGGLTAGEMLPGDVVVAQGGTLGYVAMNPHGAPGVAGNVESSGTVIAADGVTSIGGNYSQSATGTLAVELGGRIEVAGTATIEGGTLQVSGIDVSFIANSHTEVLSAAGGLTGTFDRFTETSNDLVLASSTIYYDDHSVWLDTTGLDVTWALTSGDVGYTAASANSAKRVQGAFDELNDRVATDTLAGVSGDFLHSAGKFQRAPTIAAAQASLRSLSGELHAASAAMTFRAIDAGNQALSEHLDGVRDGHASLGTWTKQLGSGGDMARSGFDGVGFQLDGWLVGNDFRVGRSGVLGFAFGQGQGLQQLQDGFDRDRSRRTEGMVYAGLAGDRWYAQGRLGFGQFRQDVSRAVLLGDGAEGVWTRYGGRYQVAYGESGLRYGFGDLRIAPFASVEYARSDRDAFAEAGAGGFGLRSDAQSQARWQASVGVRASHRWSFGKDRALDLGAHAQWFRASGTDAGAMEASFVGLQQWSPLLGIGLSRYGGLFGVGLDARLSSNATLQVGYDYEHGQFDDAHGMSAGLKLAF
ncbi:MAG: autotransporter outer membrane beta-barrel domain-containing protein [Luteimonas sp.]